MVSLDESNDEREHSDRGSAVEFSPPDPFAVLQVSRATPNAVVGKRASRMGFNGAAVFLTAESGSQSNSSTVVARGHIFLLG